MRVIEEKENIYFKRKRRHQELAPVESPELLFKVVVNNYKQQAEETSTKTEKDIDATMNSAPYGLPPQPAKYLKYPEYDWF